jgi:hypothetical protein
MNSPGWAREHRIKNLEKVREKEREFYHRNAEKRKERVAYYNKVHPEKRAHLNAVRHMIERGKPNRYVGCTPGFLRNHLESLFKPGMTWNNYGEWHVDHIVPLSWFPFDRDPSLHFVASHWTNLQPLWGRENVSKGARYPA